MPARTRDVLTRPADGPDAVVRYGDHPDQLVDIHLPPTGPAAAPLLVLLHGGFWRQEWDRRHTRPIAVALRDRGWVVVTPEFRRTGGDGGWPATFDDVAAVRERLPALLADATAPAATGSMTLVGHSAGGQLAMWWALTAPEPANVHRVVALAPVADLARAYIDGLGDGAVAALLGGGPDTYPDRYAATDPARILRDRVRDRAGIADDPPITVLHGADDDRVPAAHCRELPGIEYVELPGVGHFEPIDPLSAAWPDVLAALP